MVAKYVDAANVKMEIYRQQNGRRIRDALITVGADGKNKLDGRTYVRPGILRDIKVRQNTDIHQTKYTATSR